MSGVISFRNSIYGILIVAFWFPAKLKAQYWEIGGLLGVSHYQGDLAKDPVLKETKPCVNLFGRYNMSRHFSYRFGVGYGQVSANDSNHTSGRLRMLNFKSDIWEFTNLIEFHYNPFGLSHPKNKNFTFFVFTGLNAFYFNPKANYNGEWIALQPLATEGQNLDGGKGKYSRISVSIPMGAGIKYMIHPKFIIGFEIGYRRTFTDYLDDVSGSYPNLEELRTRNGVTAVALSDPSLRANTGIPRSAKGDMRGDPHLKDWYIFTGITLSYRFTPIVCWNQKPKSYNYIN